jgi:hypothetical protein
MRTRMIRLLTDGGQSQAARLGGSHVIRHYGFIGLLLVAADGRGASCGMSFDCLLQPVGLWAAFIPFPRTLRTALR